MPALPEFTIHDSASGNPTRGLLDDIAFQVVDALESARQGGVSSRQFRSHFLELRQLQRQYRRQGSDANAWNNLVPRLELMRAKVNYGKRKNGPLTGAAKYIEFMTKALRQGKESPAHFNSMMLFLEAVAGYFYAEGKGERN